MVLTRILTLNQKDLKDSLSYRYDEVELSFLALLSGDFFRDKRCVSLRI